jgi:hypothetical protein
VLEQKPLDEALLNNALRVLAKYRAHLIMREIARREPPRIHAGPFAGMDYVDHSSEGCHTPKILGCYEHELQPFIEAAVATGYGDVVNVGCAEGYYAVGLARRMPQARIHAFDTDSTARKMCGQVASRNGVSDRVQVKELFTGDMFRQFAGRRTFFLVDVEGNELDLIGRAPPEWLDGFDFVIECHDATDREISESLAARLEPTHAVGLVPHRLAAPALPPMLEQLGHLDQLLAVWEWRERPTPWIAAAARKAAGSPFWHAVTGLPASR